MQLLDCVEKYSLSRLNLAASSLDQIRYSVIAFERFAGSSDVESITEEQLGRFARARLKEASPATAKRNVANLVTLIRWATRKGIRSAPLPDLQPIRVDHSTPTAWSLSDLGSILDVCGVLPGEMRETGISRRLWWTSLILFLYDSGARISAALGVRRDDVLLDSGVVVLRAENAKTHHEQLVSIGPDTCERIRSLIDASPGDLVWQYPWHRRRLWIDLHGILTYAGVNSRGVGFHRLRKTHATQTVALLGWEAGRVALGHTSESMTRRYVDTRQLPRKGVILPRPKK